MAKHLADLDLAYDPREDGEAIEEYKDTYDLVCSWPKCQEKLSYCTLSITLQVYCHHLVEHFYASKELPLLPILHQMKAALTDIRHGTPGKKKTLELDRGFFNCTSCKRPTRVDPIFFELHIYHHWLRELYRH